ncbi:MAG: transposase [Rhodanobacteraceae bacterium]|nr:MAG: transposase [Rhodanobacteraceae bacterium]
MPRKPRLHLAGIPLHVTQRGVNRCAIFVDDTDRRHLYLLLRDAAAQYGIAVHAYVFMGNHIHLLLTSPDSDALPRAMRKVGQCYVQAFNHRHGRSGPLWQGRFKSCLVDRARYLMAVYRYIELNPVRAAMVERPEHYRWSSVHANLGLLGDALVTPHPNFLALGPDPVTRGATYRALLARGSDPDDLDRIRAHLQQERALGEPRFQAMVEQALGRPVVLKPCGRPRRQVDGAGAG